MRTPYPNELMHYGILGMKWGVRRYQNADGSLTAAGREHYGYSNDRSNTQMTRKERRQERQRQKDERWASKRAQNRAINDSVLKNARDSEEAKAALETKIHYDLQEGMSRKQARRDYWLGTTYDDSKRIAKMVISSMNDSEWKKNRESMKKGWKVVDALLLGSLSNPELNGSYQREGYKNLDAAYEEFKKTIGLDTAKEFAKRDREKEYYQDRAREADRARQRAEQDVERDRQTFRYNPYIP